MLTTTPQQRYTVSMRERKKGNIETAVYRLKKEPAMVLYSRPPEVQAHRLPPTTFLKRVATLLAAKTSQDKSLIMANLRCLELLKTVLIAVRGHRGRYYEKAIPVDELDLNLAHTTNDENRGDDVDDEDDEVDDEVENVEKEIAEE